MLTQRRITLHKHVLSTTSVRRQNMRLCALQQGVSNRDDFAQETSTARCQWVVCCLVSTLPKRKYETPEAVTSFLRLCDPFGRT